MVTEAGKELLRNTINTAKFHNRILEENEMWKQWELERGLTMMVSDDLILNRSKKHHRHLCSKHRKRSESKRNDHMSVIIDNNTAGSSKNVDRWDHSGYRELYPDESDSEPYSSSSTRDSSKKWDHSGYKELYPDETSNRSPAAARNKRKKWGHGRHKELNPDETDSDNYHTPTVASDKEKKWDHSGYLELYPDETPMERQSSSKTKESSKKEKKKEKKKHNREVSTSDNEIWEDFKTYKRSKALEKSKTVSYDSHVKEWKKQSKRERRSSKM